jgi:hypothetical protein
MRPATRCCMRSSVRRADSFGCAVNTGSKRRRPISSWTWASGESVRLQLRRVHPRHRLAADGCAVAEEIRAPPSDPVHLLREVHAVEPHREGARQFARYIRRQVAHGTRELGVRRLHRRCDGGSPACAGLRPARTETVAALLTQDGADDVRRAACTSSRSATCFSGNWMSVRFTCGGRSAWPRPSSHCTKGNAGARAGVSRTGVRLQRPLACGLRTCNRPRRRGDARCPGG